MPKSNLKDWNFADLVDLEYFLAQDANADEGMLTKRDREFYRDRLSEAGIISRRGLLRGWLDLRREAARTAHASPLPGEVVASILRLLPMLLFALGALVGFGLAWGVMSYAGDQPINLFVALAWLVALPFSITLFSAALPGLRLIRRGTYSGIFGGWLFGALLTRLSHRLYSLGGGGNGRSQLALAQGWGIMRGRSGLYSGVIGWRVFSLIQLAASGFSLSVLLTVFLRGWIADLAFSWQTTARVSAEQVYSLVATLARPWAGLTEQPHPTVDQVAGSRVFLKEGLQNLSNADLQSWWYFLLWAILVYTVLPRLLLLGTALLGARRAWGRMSFNDARTEALIRRMQHPQLHIGKDDEAAEDERSAETLLSDDILPKILRIQALVPEELLAGHEKEQWKSEIQRQFNASVESIVPVKLDEDEDADMLQSLGKNASQASLLLVLEGWQPCITATLEYLKVLRQILGKDPLLVVVLVGREDREGLRTPTPVHEFGVWRSRLATLGDPSLLVHNWRSGHD